MAVVPSVMRFAGDDPVNGLTSIRLVVFVNELQLQSSVPSTMSDETVQDWDQFVLRYTKLQDAIGSRLFPAVLTLLQEPYEDKPMIDKLNRLEKLGYLILDNGKYTMSAEAKCLIVHLDNYFIIVFKR